MSASPVTFETSPGALLAELQSAGIAASDDAPGAPGRRGGAGPSDHRALSLGGATVMVPMRAAGRSPFRLRVLAGAPGAAPDAGRRAVLLRDDEIVADVALPEAPRFYALATADGIPYSKIALLHARRVLASTVMQSCVRYNDPKSACQFCSIGSSLKEGRTLARKTPAQLAEVAEAAVRLDGVEQLVLTTGTPATPDRGAARLGACAAAVREAVPSLPIQVQCEPPDDFAWFARLRAAGADALGMHLEAVEPEVRAAVMPGKAEVPVAFYMEAFAAAVGVFGRGQVSTYLIAGLGDRGASLLEMAARLTAIGVYPFVVPFVAIAGTPMAGHAPPPAAMMDGLYTEVARLLRAHGLSSAEMKAGCAKCGACSALSSYEAGGGSGVLTPGVLTTINTAPGFACRVARTEEERAAYFALRRAIFCEEQGLFRGDDADDCDRAAIPFVCLAIGGGGRARAGAGIDAGPRVVGVVRVWEEAPGDFWGGRLGVEAGHRTVGAIGKWLVQAAVGTARAWGAWRFRATVQRANVPFFRRLRWSTLEEIDLLGHPHHLMQADLARYTPIAEPRPDAVVRDAA